MFEEIVEQLRSLNIQRIILFGSFARGDMHEDSDIDLFIVASIDSSEVRSFRLEVRKKLRDFIRRYGVGVDVFVETPSGLRQDNPLYRSILEEGKLLYAQP